MKDGKKFAKILRKRGVLETQNRMAMICTYTIMFVNLEKEWNLTHSLELRLYEWEWS